MPGVDFVSAIMQKTVKGLKTQNPNVGEKRIAVVEGLTNFLVNYTMNFAMLVPFLGMASNDFQRYLQAFSASDLYINSVYLATVTTLFLSSWKMAASRWEKLRSENRKDIISARTESRSINGIDFVMSFVNPGFWAGHLANQLIVTTVGVSGFIAYFYYDIKDAVKSKMEYLTPSKKSICSSIF